MVTGTRVFVVELHDLIPQQPVDVALRKSEIQRRWGIGEFKN